MGDIDWSGVWKEFDNRIYEDVEEKFQDEMVAKHGDGHYYMDPEEYWKRQKKLIESIVNAKLKEKNT